MHIRKKIKFSQILLGDKNATSLCSKNISTLGREGGSRKRDCPKDERKLIRLDHKCHLKSMYVRPFPSYRILFWCKSTKIFCPRLVILSLINFLSSFGQSRFLLPPSLLHIMQWVEMILEEAFSIFYFWVLILYAVSRVILIKFCVWPFLWYRIGGQG